MPTVTVKGKVKKFPYTPAGKKAAKVYAKKKKKKVKSAYKPVSSDLSVLQKASSSARAKTLFGNALSTYQGKK